MHLANLRVTIKSVSEDMAELETEQGQTIQIPKQLLPNATQGMSLYLAADDKPLVDANTSGKDVLNEIIKD
jgi:hypothetical protein